MAGRVVVSTLNNDTGVLATQNGMTGICKAWCSYNGSTQTVLGSFNVSSVTRTAAAEYKFNYTTAVGSNSVALAAGPSVGGVGYCVPCYPSSLKLPSTTDCQFLFMQQNSGTSNTTTDNTYSSIAVFSA
jgi:hypothetical protein